VLNLDGLRFWGIKVVVFDLDGTIIENLLLRSFWQKISFTPQAVKPFVFKTAELLEKCFARYKLNPGIIQISSNELAMGIITDRSMVGLKNVFSFLPRQLTDRIKFIQVRDRLKRINKADLNLGEEVEIWRCSKIKPHPQVLTNLIYFVKQNNLERKHVLIVDDNLHFRKAAKYLGFKTYPDPDDDSEYSDPYSCAYLFT